MIDEFINSFFQTLCLYLFHISEFVFDKQDTRCITIQLCYLYFVKVYKWINNILLDGKMCMSGIWHIKIYLQAIRYKQVYMFNVFIHFHG